MRNLFKNLTAHAMIIIAVFTFIGCEKENMNPAKQTVKATANDGQRKIVTEIHKEGGTPITFLGITIGVRYGRVEKIFAETIEVDGLRVDRYQVYCENNGDKRCRINGHSYSTDPQADDNWTEIDSGIFVNSSEMYDIMDNLIDSVDVQLLQNSNFSGSVSQTALIPLQTGGSIPLTFDLIWENGNSYGDADIEISVYYDSSN